MEAFHVHPLSCAAAVIHFTANAASLLFTVSRSTGHRPPRSLVAAQAMNTEDQRRPSEAAWTTHINVAPGGIAGHLDQQGSW